MSLLGADLVPPGPAGSELSLHPLSVSPGKMAGGGSRGAEVTRAGWGRCIAVKWNCIICTHLTTDVCANKICLSLIQASVRSNDRSHR